MRELVKQAILDAEIDGPVARIGKQNGDKGASVDLESSGDASDGTQTLTLIFQIRQAVKSESELATQEEVDRFHATAREKLAFWADRHLFEG